MNSIEATSLLAVDKKNRMLKDFIYRTIDVYELNRWNNSPQAIPDNATLRRYLNRCGWDLDYAEKLYRKMLEWRIINNIDAILKELPYPKSIEDKGGIFLAPFNHKFLDYYGIPIEIVKMSRINFADADVDDILNYLILKEETLFHKYDISDKSMILIYDFKNFTMNLSFVLNVLPKLSKISRVMDDYYAGRARKIYIINAPPLFETVYKLVSNFIPEHTTRMVYISAEGAFGSSAVSTLRVEGAFGSSAVSTLRVEGAFGSSAVSTLRVEGAFGSSAVSNFVERLIHDTPEHEELLEYLRNS